ncbi:MAG TPA: hypothetical protein VM681_08950 [Candidatus Thermoplasmatota archaeon]|nr:hypothetical protein [Candidatus Thermoplasmatota archaeon]
MDLATRRRAAQGVAAAAIAVMVGTLVGAFASPRDGAALAGLAILVLAALLAAAIALRWASGPMARHAGAARRAAVPEIVIRCRSCQEVFAIADTGSRPLTGSCPHCGAIGTVRRAGPA